MNSLYIPLPFFHSGLQAIHDPHAFDIGNGHLRSLYEFWDAKRGSRIAPERSDFAVHELKPWLGHLIILDNVHNLADIRYRLYGTSLIEIFGFDLTRKTVGESEALIGRRPLIEYEAVSRLSRPVYVSRFSPSTGEHIQVDKLALPLMSGDRVDQILAAVYRSENAEAGS